MVNTGLKAKIYVISLKGSDKRRANIKEQMAKFGIQYEIVDAVRGSELDLQTDSRIDQEAVKRHPHWLTPGAIGCALSHLECYRRAKEEDLDLAIIFEDDAKIESDPTQYLDKILKHLKDKQIALLYYTSWNTVYLDAGSKIQLDDKTALYGVKEGLPITATAYILPRSAYLSLLENSIPIRVACDKWDYFIEKNMLSSIACVYPNPIDTMDFKSDIAYLDAGFKKRLSETIDRNRIFPFYQILREMRKRTKLKMKQTKIV